MSSQYSQKVTVRVTEAEDAWLDYMMNITGYDSKSDMIRSILHHYRQLLNDDAYRSLADKASIAALQEISNDTE